MCQVHAWVWVSSRLTAHRAPHEMVFSLLEKTDPQVTQAQWCALRCCVPIKDTVMGTERA